MALQPLPIRLLSSVSQARLRSAGVITSLNDVIIGLLENVLDAGATSAKIRLDYVKGYCSVTDNGHGIPAAEFRADGHLGSLHWTSKLDRGHATYGRYGRFLYHLAALSLLSISSKTNSSTSTVTFHRANIIARSNGDGASTESIHGEYGTHVIVANLFGDIPVRNRYIAARLESRISAEAEFATLKKRIAALILACGRAIDIKVVDTKTSRTYKHQNDSYKRSTSFDLGAIASTLQQAGYINVLQAASFKLISVQTSTIRIRAAVSLRPAPAKDVQFISISNRPVHHSVRNSIFSDEINSVFDSSNFGTAAEEVDLPEGEQNRDLKHPRLASDKDTDRRLDNQKKGVDRWPMFYVRIDPQTSRTSITLDNDHDEAGLSEKWVEKILSLLRSMFFEFLSVHQFRPRARRGKELERTGLKCIATTNSVLPTAEAVKEVTRIPIVRATSEHSVVPKYFDAWSKVKTGITTTKPTQKSIIHDEQTHPVGSSKDISRPQTPVERVRLAQNALCEVELQVLDDADLELLVEDYHSETASDSAVCTTTGVGNSDRQSETNAAQALDVDDAAYLWTHPATGIEHKINARNGLILSQTSLTSTGPSVVLNADNSILPTAVLAETTVAHHTRVKPARKSPTDLIASLRQSDLIRSFCSVEERIPSIVPKELDDRATARQNHDCGRHHGKTSDYFSAPVNMRFHNLTKADLESAIVLAQVDQKFLLVQTRPANDSDPLLVLIDQHAADERIIVEELYKQLCSGISTTLDRPIMFKVAQKEIELLQRNRKHFAQWQIIYEVRDKGSEGDSMRQIVVVALPSLISERCRLNPKLLIDLLRREIHHASSFSSFKNSSTNWIHRVPHMPQGLVEMVNSRACRSAIMFNDVLSRDQCEALLQKLVTCTLPFQCAHGRPSCAILPEWTRNEHIVKDDLNFVNKYRQWTGASHP